MKYIKNINPQSSNSAYLEHTSGIFDLHFNHIPSIVPIGEVILLTQKIDGVRYFTHLVSPVESKIRTSNDASFNKSIRVKCLACAKKAIPEKDTLIKDVKAGGYATGRIVPLENMKSFSNKETRKLFIDEVYEKFNKFF